VSEWMLISVKKDGGLVFHNLNCCIRTISNNNNVGVNVSKKIFFSHLFRGLDNNCLSITVTKAQ
jgi:hypothetical protein